MSGAAASPVPTGAAAASDGGGKGAGFGAKAKAKALAAKNAMQTTGGAMVKGSIALGGAGMAATGLVQSEKDKKLEADKAAAVAALAEAGVEADSTGPGGEGQLVPEKATGMAALGDLAGKAAQGVVGGAKAGMAATVTAGKVAQEKAKTAMAGSAEEGVPPIEGSAESEPEPEAQG